ncbi:hypothetical protein [Acerihabitans arboris]|uniref:Uncharacterized protein n=1 Tax=Acerihabitans arboris TaxID=2691583 RepID=A0A845SJX3_9GAMM|nr:hypothetical protein [Acerihabitans arboris]NDL64249.1 hypothetical protein [Acerihabitans arboris]
MAKTNRDEFLKPIRQALAARAGHKCSFAGCDCPTSGPSEESDESSTSIGVAAHIHAAAPGGPRYLESMTAGQRKSINNGIWLCANHSIEIDRDATRYSADELKRMKIQREQKAAEELSRNSVSNSVSDLFEIGPNIIGLGELIGSSSTNWIIQLEHFLAGDIFTLNNFISSFQDLRSYDRYLLVNELGDGRELSSAPEWKKINGQYFITCPIKNDFPRIPAQDLGTDIALNNSHDIFITNGDLTTVSGLDALPQKLKINLSLMRGESVFHPNYGSRLKLFFDNYRDTAWLNRLFKLDVIRMASIPYNDDNINFEISTPLKCVTRVNNVFIHDEERKDNWLPIDFDLDIKGIGNWKNKLSIHVMLDPNSMITVG